MLYCDCKGGFTLKNRIKEIREANKLTQEDLAKLCKVTRQTIISLEKGKYDPSIQLAHSIAEVFHTQIEKIFIFEEEA